MHPIMTFSPAKKDYPAEAAFVRNVIRSHNAHANSLLDLGCSSACHAVEFVRTGFRVTGIDRSAEMIALGHERRKSLPPQLREQLNLMQCDGIRFRSASKSHVVASLFHVV
jgi:ubiquinone/menaquinone biosynthesis C-methylase UbiE